MVRGVVMGVYSYAIWEAIFDDRRSNLEIKKLPSCADTVELVRRHQNLSHEIILLTEVFATI